MKNDKMILSHIISFKVPGFSSLYKSDHKSYSLSEIDSEIWYNNFIDEIINSIGKDFLPICRLSDGEFMFLVGRKLSNVEHGLKRMKFYLLKLKDYLFGFNSWAGSYAPGQYSRVEIKQHKKKYLEQLRLISNDGVLALHLSFGKNPFQEQYFRPIIDLFAANHILLNSNNYFPFYFVYAALSGNRRAEIFKGRRVLAIHGSDGDKRNNIINSLLSEGVAQVFWHQISSSRSLFDVIEIAPYFGKVDFVLVGAGIGKPNILVQLKPLKVPCIDAGYMFEVWSNPSNANKRPFCKPDNQ